MHRAFRSAVAPVVALAVALGLLLPNAVPAAAAEPHRPLPGYRPAFVTERDAGPWVDCLWASTAMLVDKWTAGEIRVSKDRLRALSGDRHGGSNLTDLRIALRALALPMSTSPGPGTSFGWSALRSRLAHGGGAVIQGDYGDLPRQFGRWDLAFWGKKGAGDDHALYLDRYDRRRDRFWVMDPLAPDGWAGEWIPGRSIRAFAWTAAGGALYGIMTPRAEAGPFDGVELDEPYLFVIDDAAHIEWRTLAAPDHWKVPGSKVVARMTRLADGIVAPGPMVGSVPASGLGNVAESGPDVVFESGRLSARLPIPVEPGVYRADVVVRETRFGQEEVVSGPATIFVAGDRRAQIDAWAELSAVAGTSVAVEVAILNTGTTDWSNAVPAVSGDRATNIPQDTRLVAHWIPVSVAADGAGPTSVALDRIPLGPGSETRLTVHVPAPPAPGRWALMFDVTDDVQGSFALGGSQPASILVDVSVRIGASAE